jgi:carbon monoxide dehydrogenase subunit G
MKIEQTVEVDAPLERVWALVNDVPRIAPCMPGAQLTNVVDERTYEGTIRVKLGPINMSYKGTAVLEEVDEAGHSARIAASGKDVRGGGTARAGVDTRLEALSESRTRMAVTADVQLTGKVASFGRGAIQDVSAKLFGQFAECLRQTLEEESRAGAGAEAAEPSAEQAEIAAQAAAATASAAAAGAPTPSGEAAPPPAAPAAPAPSPPPAASGPPPRTAEPIRAGRLAGTAFSGMLKAWWAATVAFFRRLFGGRGAA